MATTYDALVSGENVAIETTITIEGYGYVLTTGSASAAVTAYSGTDWSSALSGLSVFWRVEQNLHPWEPFKGGGGSLSFAVMDADGSDRFGIDVHKKTASASSPLASSKDPDDTTIVVLRSDDFDAADSTIYIGSEAIGYTTNTTATETFSTLTRGKWSPFTCADGDRFARSHRVNSTIPGVNLAPDVTNIPTEWIGRWVAVRLHRRLGTVLDTVAESHLAYVGRIASVRDSGDGQTIVELEHVLEAIANTPVFREPWRARLREGVWLRQTTQFNITTDRAEFGGAHTGGSADPLNVVPSGASTAYEIDEGFYTASELQFYLNRWLATAFATSDIVLSCTFTARRNTTAGVRSSVEWADGTSGGAIRKGHLRVNANWVAGFLGWEPDGMMFGTEYTDGISITATNGISYSPLEPTRIATLVNDVFSEVRYHSAQGSWFDQSAYIPTILANGTFTKGIVKVGNQYYLAGTPSSGEIELRRSEVLDKLAGTTPAPFGASGTGVIEIQQVLVMEGSFFGQFLAFLLSTGASGFNSANWDLFPEHVGLGIPYSILTSDFETELAAAPGAALQRTVIIEKPVTFADLFEWAFAVRHLQLVWGNGRLSLTGWATPTTGATLTATEATKAVPVGQQDTQIAVGEQSDKWLRNVVKIEHDRLPFADTYQSSHTIDHKKSSTTHGSRAITIKARDAVSGNGLLGENIDSLLPSFIAGLPFLTKPVALVRVPVSFSQFITHRPGQSVLFTDDFMRDPSTGERGITGKPALIVGAWYDWGGGVNSGQPRAPQGELTLMLFPGRQLAPYCPAGDIDETADADGFSSGYNSSTSTIRLKAHAYSESTDAVDASHFEAGDVIVIVEKDPATAASPTTWTRTIDSVSSNDITLTSALSSPAWDANKLYRVHSAAFGSAQASQQTDCYQADDADDEVADARESYAYAYFGAGQVSNYTAASAATLPERHVAAAYGDGKALDTGNAFVVANNLNNLLVYKTAAQAPRTYSEEADFGAPAGSQTWAAARIEVVPIGRHLPGRDLYVAPIFRSSDGASASVRVTLLRDLPSTSDVGRWDIDRPQPYQETTFTDTSTSNVFPSAVALNTDHLRLGDEDAGGVGYLLVEVSEKAEFVGLSELYVGPPDDPRLIEPYRHCTNGCFPDADFYAHCHAALNDIMVHRGSGVFARSNVLGDLATGLDTNQTHWRWRFRSGYGQTKLRVIGILGTAYNSGGVGPVTGDPSITINVTDAGGTTSFTARGSMTDVTPTDAPSEWIPFSHTIDIDPATAYECEITGNDFARIIAFAANTEGDPEIDDTVDYYTEYEPGGTLPIYDSNVQRLIQGSGNALRRNGGLHVNWCLNNGAARTRVSATPINLIDNSTTGNPTATTPGFRFNTTARNTASRTTVPIEIAIYASNVGAGPCYVELVDTSGTQVAAVEIEDAGLAWHTNTGLLSVGSGEKYDLRFYSDGSNTLTVYAVSIQEYEV